MNSFFLSIFFSFYVIFPPFGANIVYGCLFGFGILRAQPEESFHCDPSYITSLPQTDKTIRQTD